MDWYIIFDDIGLLPFSLYIRNSMWLFPAIEAVHLLGLAMLGGALLMVDLRLMGLGLINQPVEEVNYAARRWLLVGLGILFATGIPLGMSEAVKLYWSEAFWIKFYALSTALILVYPARAWVIRNRANNRWITCGVGIVSLGTWSTVAAAGRWIGFS